VRRVKTASGATAVQIVHKRGRVVVGIDHIGSAHDDARLELLLHTARERLHGGQQALELELEGPAPMAGSAGRPVVEATGSLVPWDALVGLYAALGFAVIRDEAFRALVSGRIIEPTSKIDTVRVLTEVGVAPSSRATFRRCLQRIVERGYRGWSRRPATRMPPVGAGWCWCWCSTTSPRSTSRPRARTGYARSA
jgi:hypothetical protein